jgi:hypothetical protein
MFRIALFGCIFVGIGLGLISCTFFLWTWLIGAPPGGVLWMFMLGYAAVGIVLFRSFTKSELSDQSHRHALHATLFALLCLYVGSFSITKYLTHPHGDWDAWAIWNLHARLLYRGGAQWSEMVSRNLYDSLQDYPLLVPSLVANGWKLAGTESTAVPAFVGILFTFAVIALLVSSVSFLSNDGRGFAAGLVLLGTPDFILQGANQMADVPLGFFILLTVVLLYLSERSEENNFFLVLSGMAAGFAAWTKNEGLLFLVCLFAARLLVGWIYKSRARLGREMRMFCCGLLPILSIVLSFKFLLSPPNYIFASAWDFIGRLKDSSRYIEVSRYFAQGIAAFGAGRISPLIAAGDYLLCFGRRPSNNGRGSQLATLLLLSFMLGGYFMIYIVSPNDLQWHLNTSFNRLLLHLWPTFVFCIACTGIHLGRRS